MSRYIGPKCKLCRREGVKLFLKGDKCESPKCPVVVRQSVPGPRRRRRSKPTDYSYQLREKQKAKRIYGLTEAQARRYFLGSAPGFFLVRLESRLDNVIYRLGFARSRAEARQLVRHRKFKVSNHLVRTASLEVKPGDVIMPLGIGRIETPKPLPGWLEYNDGEKLARVKNLPSRDIIGEDINDKLIVEFYSR